jgi:predicted RNA-binding Zn-ribbon protein involved in translation (DUF1610 family)
MESFQKIDMEPALCPKCKKFLVLNYKLENICPHCGAKVVFYNEKSTQDLAEKGKVNDEIIEWGEFKLPNTSYLCPNCEQIAMHFRVKGYWD